MFVMPETDKEIRVFAETPMYRFVQAKQEGVEEFRATLKKNSERL